MRGTLDVDLATKLMQWLGVDRRFRGWEGFRGSRRFRCFVVSCFSVFFDIVAYLEIAI